MAYVDNYELDEPVSGKKACFLSTSAGIKAEEGEANLTRDTDNYREVCRFTGSQGLSISGAGSRDRYTAVKYRGDKLSFDAVMAVPDSQTEEIEIEILDARYSCHFPGKPPVKKAQSKVNDWIREAEEALDHMD